ncbi:hypothetical protein CAI21_20720 [Alkalilimnicola ehrlichii]|uniref:Diguanylate cyclase/phosphodiesterase with PAS/PAC sensor(S) n=1 Tax=Alkalilimnicola ehrlichii TaxID=351052 RepID=A0A3E0WFU8_9GAMM|nr:EAL domain-containing protein [Alkalilimnicola ehrlichii]RFA24712.1 hypothetical protein CAI21_20720 [Alkalilimnicola ehrlichii]RFA31810.1 hypothetical protein CAL65_21490 [Alkalilimnicola ehrlichii]
MRRFLIIFLPVACLVALVVGAFQYHGYSIERNRLNALQAHAVSSAATTVKNDLESIGADLQLLVNSPALREAIGSPTPNWEPVAQELEEFAYYKSLYERVSFIDLDGREQVLFDLAEQFPLSPDVRPLTDDPMAWIEGARPGQLSVSGLDIFTGEDGRDHLRISVFTPVEDLQGRVRGILAVAYHGERFLENLQASMADAPGVGFIVNAQGQWMPYGEWVNVWPEDAEAESFQAVDGEAWEVMAVVGSGQFVSEEGLYSFITVDPLTVVPERLGVALPAIGEGEQGIAQASWKIVSFVDAAILAAAQWSRVQWGGLILLAILLPCGGASWYIAGLLNSRARSTIQARRLGAVVEQTDDLVVITDAEGAIRYVNPAFLRKTGYQKAEIIGQSSRCLRSRRKKHGDYQQLWDAVRAREAYKGVLVTGRKDGSDFYQETTVTPLREPGGATVGFVATGRDVTERIRDKEKLQRLAFQHPLTGLPNRALFRDHLAETVARARRNGSMAAVLFLDLDRFKKINDSLGHKAGDTLLCQVAERLRNNVRDSDIVAHIAGDEFTILLNDIYNAGQIHTVAGKILQTFEPPFTVEGQQLFMGVSMGVAVYPNDAEHIDKLVELADTAMYYAKRLGRNQYQFYSTEMTAAAHERLRLETELRQALGQRDFELHFQPIVDPLSGRITSFEALIRWRPAGQELRPPSEFVPVLEDTGLIVSVTRWILKESCLQCRRLQAAGLHDVSVTVNVSPRSFYQSDIVSAVKRALQFARLPATNLVLEVTEGLLLEDNRAVRDALWELRALGVHIAIDDFGTGYSSLAYLTRLPADILKIDREFIGRLGPDPRDTTLVAAMLALAQEMGLRVVAEGVETIDQLAFLQSRYCTGTQGFLFSAALPIDQIEAHVKADRHWPWQDWMQKH